MVTLSNQQLSQVNNILHTLLEATEHFHHLIKSKELNQGIYIFSSVVEGFGAISNMISSHNEELSIKKKKVETYLLQISRLFEEGKLIKVSEVLQFSLLPLLKNMYEALNEEIDDPSKDIVYNIGIFSSHSNPRKLMPKPRLMAMLKESERQNARLLFFTEGDVDFNKNEIIADVYVDKNWQSNRFPLPEVISNIGAGKRTHTERKLRRTVPFTSFYVGNKFHLPQRIEKYRKFADLLVPFQLCRNENTIFTFLEKNNRVVFKALSSNRGENIFFVTKRGSRYILSEHKKEKVLNQEIFTKWLKDIILKRKESFIIQRYVHTRTKNGEPYHIRAHVQKNGEGKWVLTHIYPRVGNRRSNLSNIENDGRVEDFHSFLKSEYGEQGESHEKKILDLSLEIAKHLDKLHDFALEELGIDLAIDENGKYWMHEANNGPQTAYHEEKRAVNTIAYAKYIAKNQIVHTDNVFHKGFKSRLSNLPYAQQSEETVIGMLLKPNEDLGLITLYASDATKQNVTFYTFTPKDIDFNEMLIKGNFYINGEWVEKITKYPHVIIDNLKQRENENLKFIYEEFEEVQFTNKWPTGNTLRADVYNHILETGNYNKVIPSYQYVSKTRDIFRFLEQYQNIMLKPAIGLSSNHTQYIRKMKNGKYLINKGANSKEYSELPLLNKFKDAISQQKFIVQKDPRGVMAVNDNPFTLSVHGILNKDNSLDLVSDYAESLGGEGLIRIDSREFLVKKYGEKQGESFYREIKSITNKLVFDLKNVYEELISELSLTFGISYSGDVFIMEINPSGPDYIYNREKLTQAVIRYASELHNY